ncbi:HPr family phosphocarrier protein [Burkholderia vietnamiensis]|uniref:HPr family phosphocarrier protein n=1 Tax=Burkholderia vietnamiensis TaxID=60552 RepID=UPI000AB67C4D|nr:HPr family phosphocarrier protein [Burkholderia vietnamiensis]
MQRRKHPSERPRGRGAEPAGRRAPFRPRASALIRIVATVVYVQIGAAWNRKRANHARDALVAAARRFESDILLIANGVSAAAKDAAAIAALQLHGGTSAQLLATGRDEDTALQALLPLLQAG